MDSTFSENRIPDFNYIAFFDLDNTIISINSGKTLIRQSFKNKLISRWLYIAAVFLSVLYKIRLYNDVLMLGRMIGWLKGTPVNEMEQLSRKYFRQELINSIYPGIRSEIELHRAQGAAIVMLSSAILPICAIIGEYLMFDDIICTGLEQENGKYTGKVEGNYCHGFEKARRLSVYCNTRNIDPMNCWYYADSVNDLFAFEITGFPVCVNPEKKLVKEAEKRGWRILRLQ